MRRPIRIGARESSARGFARTARRSELADGVEALIRVHEWGGSPDANLVQAADSLSFLETNIDLMLGFARTGKYPDAEVALKIDAMYERIQLPAARELARPMWEQAKLRLRGLLPPFGTGVRPLYLRPESLDALLCLCATHGPGARLLAGGTDLLVRLRKGVESPSVIVDVKRVAELRSDVVEIRWECIRIGARTVMTDVIEDRRIRQHFPALVDAARTVGSVQIRNRATLAGNLCNASPAADTAPVLLAHRASLNLVSAGGTRQMALDDFFTGPGRTVLAPGELVASIDLPAPSHAHGRGVWPAHAAAWSRPRDRQRLLRRSRVRRGPFCLWRRRAPPVRRHVPSGCTARRCVDARAP